MCDHQVAIQVLTAEQIAFGKCTASYLNAPINPEVGKFAITTNGVLVELNDNAVKAISAAYTGHPLQVTFTQPCCACGACCMSCTTCCNFACDFTPHLYVPVTFATIVYGNQPNQPSIDGPVGNILNCFFGASCCISINLCLMQKIKLDWTAVTVPGAALVKQLNFGGGIGGAQPGFQPNPTY